MTAEMRPPTSPNGSQDSLEGLHEGMRMVWLGPEGVAWVHGDGSTRVRSNKQPSLRV